MNKQKHVFTAALFLAASTLTPALATPTLASDFKLTDLKPYVGVDFSYLNFDYTDSFGLDLIAEDEFAGANPYVGFQVHDNIGLEVGYLETGRSDKSFDGTAITVGGTTIGGNSSSTKISGVHFDVMGNYSVTDKFEALGTVGIARFEADIETNTSIGNIDDTDTAWRIGAGGRYALTDNFGLRSIVRYNHIDFDDNAGDAADGFWQANLGVQYRF